MLRNIWGYTGIVKYQLFIAKRYLSSGRYFVAVATWITTLGVTLGVATVCFVMSMTNGFESEIRTRLIGTTSHISFFPLYIDVLDNYNDLVAKVEKIEGVTAASAFVYYKAAISSASAGDGIIIRGIDLDQERKTSDLEKNITAGGYTFVDSIAPDDTIPAMILGSTLADRLGVFIGSPVVLYSLRGEDLRANSRPRVAKYYISGIFETGVYELDGELAYISLPSAQKLFKTGNAVTAVHARIVDIYKADEMASTVDSALGHMYDVVPWTELHRNLFSYIAAEKKILFLGFTLIVLVAAFSMISTLVMMTMEKRPEIGILKTMGSTPADIGRIFVYKGLAIGIFGVVSGWALALSLSIIQNRFEIITLPPDIYFISYLPVEPHIVDFLATGGVTVLICFLASLYPARQASQLQVVDVIRQ
ncbi:MAG: ABC transporter permease [Candidatus Zixiibacteriota bacterium]